MESINNLKWRDVLELASKELTDVSYRTWFLPLVPLKMDDEKGIMYLALTETFKANMFSKNPRYTDILETAIKEVFRKNYHINITHKTEDEIKEILEGKKSKAAEPSIDEDNPYRDMLMPLLSL